MHLHQDQEEGSPSRWSLRQPGPPRCPSEADAAHGQERRKRSKESLICTSGSYRCVLVTVPGNSETGCRDITPLPGRPLATNGRLLLPSPTASLESMVSSFPSPATRRLTGST